MVESDSYSLWTVFRKIGSVIFSVDFNCCEVLLWAIDKLMFVFVIRKTLVHS